MSRRTVWIIAGVLVVAGAAASIAAVGHREGRFGHRGQMDGMMDGDGFGGGRMGGGWRGPRAITQDEFDSRTRERFARLDKNSDGVVDKAEIEGGMTAGDGDRGGRMGEMMQQRFLARFDTNRDGKVGRDEFLDRVKKEFARADLDNDGRITDDDLPPMMRGRDVLKNGSGRGMGGRGGMADGMMGRMIEADANKDGIITLDEVVAAATKRFDQFDRNKDGAVDKADFDAMRNDMTAYRVQRFLHGFGADKDGKVTREQFFNAAKERFAERDVNRDGRLDRSDFGGGMGPGSDRGGDRGRGPGRDKGGRGMMGPGPDAAPDAPAMRDRGPPR